MGGGAPLSVAPDAARLWWGVVCVSGEAGGGGGRRTIRDLMHPPVDVNVEDADQLVPACGVRITADAGEELVHEDVIAYDRVQDPFCSRKSGTRRLVLWKQRGGGGREVGRGVMIPSPRYVTPSRPILNGSTPPIRRVPFVVSFLPASRQRPERGR